MASAKVDCRCVSLPTGTKISISTSKGVALRMLQTGDNLAAALFPLDDVDFRIEIDNTRSQKGVTFEITINNESHWYSVGPSVKGEPMQALVANGRKLHFKSQATDEGRLLVAATANKYAMRYDDASVMCSRIKFTFKVEKQVERIPVLPLRRQLPYDFHEPRFCMRSCTDQYVDMHDYTEDSLEDCLEDTDCSHEVASTLYGATPAPRAGERGVICYGEESNQAFGTPKQAEIDEMYVIKPFVIELRMEPRYSPV